MQKKIVALSLVLMLLLSCITAFAQSDSSDVGSLNENLLVHYTFEGDAQDVSGNERHGIVAPGAKITTVNGNGVLKLDGTATSYFEIPCDYMTDVYSFTISANMYIDPQMPYSTQWLWSFANTTAPGANNGGYMGALIASWRGGTIYAITQSGYNNEQFVQNGVINGVGTGQRVVKGSWKNVTITYDAGTSEAKFYLDGSLTGVSFVSTPPAALSNFTKAYIGKAPFAADEIFNGYVDDFRVYNVSLTDEEVADLAEDIIKVNIEDVVKNIKLGDLSGVIKDLTLPTTWPNGATIVWESSNPDVLTNTGVITRTDKDEEVILTATINYGGFSETITYNVTVLAEFTDEQKIEYDKKWFLNKYGNNVKYSLREEYVGPEGTTIKLSFPGDSDAISSDGTVTRYDEDVKVDVTATMQVGDKTITETLNLTVKAKDVYTGYLFVYFGADDTYENVYYALSRDGKNWAKVTDVSRPIAVSTKGHGNVRDPQIVRGPEGLTLIHTNGTAPAGWGYGAVSSDFFSIWESNDNLATWENEKIVYTIPGSYTNWAPEIYYDDANRQYVVHLAIRYVQSDKHVTYYMTSPDLVNFSEPKVLFDPGYSTIDSTIQYEDGLYYIFYKNEENASNHVTGKKVILTTTPDLYDQSQYVFYDTTPIFPTNAAIEGPTVFRTNDDTKWYALADEYGGGKYPMWEADSLAGPWVPMTEGITVPQGIRHGTIIGITEEEFQAICDEYDFDFDSIEFEHLQKTKPENILPPQDDPILWYKFDGEKSDYVVDYSGNGNHGTYYGNATHSEDAKYGNSLYLDGDGSYVKMPNHLLKNVSSVTITSWAKLDPSMPEKQRIFDFGTDTNAYMFLSLNAADNTVQFTITNTGVGGSRRHLSRRSLPVEYIGTWVHTAAVLEEQLDGTYTMKLYINGEPFYFDLTGVDIGPWSIGGLNNYIGRSQFLANGDKDLKGNIDDFRVYTRALSPEEIWAMYNYMPAEISFDKDEIKAGEEITASATVLNYELDEKFTMFIALYDEDNKLVKVVSNQVEIPLGTEEEISVSITIPEEVDTKGYTLKSYLWKGIDSAKPYAQSSFLQ